MHLNWPIQKLYILTLSLADIKKCIEWRLQVQIAFSMEVNLAPSRPEQPCKEYRLPGRSMLPAGQNFGCFLMKEKQKIILTFLYSIGFCHKSK
jgi:hypothetical protein